MITRGKISVKTNLFCDRLCLDLHCKDFLYYDKDGFELNVVEQKYYKLMGFKLNDCLNHKTFTTEWYRSHEPKLIVDHSLILYRCGYSGDAARQLHVLKTNMPQATLLLGSKPKWGFDFALDGIDKDGNVFEILHIEYDNKNLDAFLSELNSIQDKIDNIDWLNASHIIETEKEKWVGLQGFAQNDYKAKRLLGWCRAESTEKTI